ncbi:hypothetical protein AB0K93_14495 [Streptomyces sp. NPDC052676]|uniref:hypothetical protein n=1 Tax=Streptomyces sp. NPDC052676 TaxID=3154953 RepID=UPI0034443A10
MAVDPLIELRNVHKHFGELQVLRDIDLTVGKGEVAFDLFAHKTVPQNLAPDAFLTAPESERARDLLAEILRH